MIFFFHIFALSYLGYAFVVGASVFVETRNLNLAFIEAILWPISWVWEEP